jgi:cell division protein FtsI/penicillin-binding protein 2
MTLIDDLRPHDKTKKGIVLGQTLDGQLITQRYRGGRLPRSSHRGIGRVSFMEAMEQSSNIYFSLLPLDTYDKPDDLIKAARNFGLGNRSGLELTSEAAGNLPHDVRDNVSSIYSTAIGQHTLMVTPIQAVQIFNVLVNHGAIYQPQIISEIAEIKSTPPQEVFSKKTGFPYENNLKAIGIYFPFFSETREKKFKLNICKKTPKIGRILPLPPLVRNYLLESLYQVMIGEKGSGRYQAISYLIRYPKARRIYQKLQQQMIGKTGTAEVFYKMTLDQESRPLLIKHLWFGATAFPEQEKAMVFENPELTVIVLLKYGDWGKEAAPLAALMIDKWRELEVKYQDK